MQKVVAGFLGRAAADLARQIGAELGKVAKTDSDQEALQAARAQRIELILANLDTTFWDELPGEVQQYLTAVATDGAREGLLQLQAAGEEVTQEQFDQANLQAIEYAKDRGAELVGKKVVAGELVDNPNAQWQIDTDTREQLRDLVGDALDEGWSNDKLAREISDSSGFDADRAENIARTETARADVQGNLAGYRASGAVAGKQWLTAPDCCDECQALNDVVVGLEDDFPDGGGDGAPLHPRCRCDVLPVMSTPDEPIDDEDRT